MAPTILPSATYLRGLKVDKRTSKKKGRKAKKKKKMEKCFFQQKTQGNLLPFLETNMTEDEITLPALRQSFANAIKCRYKSPTLIHLI